MTISPIASLPGEALSHTSATQPGAKERAKALEAARDFEAIFVRQLLQPLEKVQSLGGNSNSGQQIYGSMMVGALADAATRGGGIGLSDLIANALVPPVPNRNLSPSATPSVAPKPPLKT
jgi:peptidoglycan hydrolase FlgJ